MSKNKLSASATKELLEILESRFKTNKMLDKIIKWEELAVKLKKSPAKLWSLNEMEMTGGAPDIVGFDNKTGEYIFYDCAPESPKGRRSLCYDHDALESRKKHKPENSAINMAADMGVDILTEEEYRALQKKGAYDLKTSSWVATPAKIRALGGALFCDRRFDHVFTYHNGAESYYGSRGFRASLRV